jgi:hypothetical protein
VAWWIEFPVLLVIYETFEVLRNHATGRSGPAQRNARWIVDLERWTWTLHEHRLNLFVADHKTLAQGMDIYYGTVHFVAPVVVLAWLWRHHPLLYRRWLMILAVLTVASLPLFWRVPVAPPRLYQGSGAAAATLVDTDARFGGMGPFDRGNFKDKNPYAAMPSLHVAWSTWCACAVVAGMAETAGGRRRRWRWLAFAFPACTLIVVMGTANHWFLDGVGGWVILAGAWAAASRCTQRVAHGKEKAVHAVVSGAPA